MIFFRRPSKIETDVTGHQVSLSPTSIDVATHPLFWRKAGPLLILGGVLVSLLVVLQFITQSHQALEQQKESGQLDDQESIRVSSPSATAGLPSPTLPSKLTSISVPIDPTYYCTGNEFTDKEARFSINCPKGFKVYVDANGIGEGQSYKKVTICEKSGGLPVSIDGPQTFYDGSLAGTRGSIVCGADSGEVTVTLRDVSEIVPPCAIESRLTIQVGNLRKEGCYYDTWLTNHFGTIEIFNIGELRPDPYLLANFPPNSPTPTEGPIFSTHNIRIGFSSTFTKQDGLDVLMTFRSL